MTDKIKQALVGEMATLVWRAGIIGLIIVLGWIGNRQINRVDALEGCTAKKTELSEMKDDVKSIEATLSRELPKIANFMGCANEYMRTH